MATLSSPKSNLFFSTLIIFLLSHQSKVHCSIYQVGDLDAWGIPSSSNPKVYTYWAKSHDLKIGDSLCKSLHKTHTHTNTHTERVSWFLAFVYLQFSCTLQAKIPWSNWRGNPTTAATSKIRSCTWIMATPFSISPNRGISTSPAASTATVANRRSFMFLSMGMEPSTPTRRPPVRPLLPPPIPRFSAPFRFRPLRLRLRRRWGFRFWWLRQLGFCWLWLWCRRKYCEDFFFYRHCLC